MKIHYSQPKGFVGRSICYGVVVGAKYYGHIIGGSATRFLPGRNEFFGINIHQLNHVVNNIFFNISPPINEKYPMRNFAGNVVRAFESQIMVDWKEKYGDDVWGFETLVEKPRTGECYRRVGWEEVGETVGYTCKRVSGKSSDSWTGKRIWITDPDKLRPKTVLCKKIVKLL